MLIIALAIAPIFVLILLGHALRRGGIPSTEFWDISDRLVYWVLMPSLLFYNTSTAKYDAALVASYAVVIVGAFACAAFFGFFAARLAGLSAPVSTSVLQGAARHNTFIVLALAERLYGVEGLALAALASAILIPVTNLTIVTLMVGLLSNKAEARVSTAILHDLVRNPLLVGVGLGVIVNLAWGTEIPVVHDVTKILGSAALPIMLLCVGASLRVRAMAASAVPMLLAGMGKLVVFPAMILVLALLMDLTPTQMLVALLYGAAPTATSAYTLARQLGGDAPLMAAIVTVQTAISFLSLPATLLIAKFLM